MDDYTEMLERIDEHLDSVKLHALRLVCNGEYYDRDKVDAIYEDLAAIKESCFEAWRQAYKITENAKCDLRKLEEKLDSERR